VPPVQPLNLEVTLREADVRAGLALTITRHTQGARFLPLFYVLSAVALSFGLWAVSNGHRLDVPQAMFGVALVAFMLGVPGAIWRFARKSFAAVPEPRATWRLTADTLQLQSGDALTTLPWKDIHGVSETGRAFYVHPKPGAYLVLPKRDLDDGEAARVRVFFAQIPKRSRAAEMIAWLSPAALLVLGVAGYALYTFFTR